MLISIFFFGTDFAQVFPGRKPLLTDPGDVRGYRKSEVFEGVVRRLPFFLQPCILLGKMPLWFFMAY